MVDDMSVIDRECPVSSGLSVYRGGSAPRTAVNTSTR